MALRSNPLHMIGLLQLFIGDSKHIEVCSTCQIHQKSCMLLLDTSGFLMVIQLANHMIIY